MKINKLLESKKLKENWTQFKFTSGGNPYIAKTEDEVKRMLTKYKGRVKQNTDGSYTVDDSEKDMFRVDENAHHIKLSPDSKMVQIDVDDNSEIGDDSHPIQRGLGGHSLSKFGGSIKGSRKSVDEATALTTIKTSRIPRNATKLKGINRHNGEPQTFVKNKNGWTYDHNGVYVHPDTIRYGYTDVEVLDTDPNYKPKRTRAEYVVQGNYGYGWEDLTSSDDPAEAKNDLKAYRENETGVPHRLITRRVPVTENLKEAFKPSNSGIQSVKCYNRYNYTIQELRIDNDNKTFERGQFTASRPDKKTKNRQEFEDIVDTLKALGYTEIKSDYRSMRNKSRNGVPTNESKSIKTLGYKGKKLNESTSNNESAVENFLNKYGFTEERYPHITNSHNNVQWDIVNVSFVDGISAKDFNILKKNASECGASGIYLANVHKDSTDDNELWASIEFEFANEKSVEEAYEWKHTSKDGRVGRIRQYDDNGKLKHLTRDQAKEIAKFRGHDEDELSPVNDTLQEEWNKEWDNIGIEIEKEARAQNISVDFISTDRSVMGAFKAIFEIDRGDWKHDHWAFDEVVKEYLANHEKYALWKIDTNEIGSSMDDCYSAEHIAFIVPKDKMEILNSMRGLFAESVNPAELTDCPECGGNSFDSKRGKCTKCNYREELSEYKQVNEGGSEYTITPEVTKVLQDIARLYKFFDYKKDVAKVKFRSDVIRQLQIFCKWYLEEANSAKPDTRELKNFAIQIANIVRTRNTISESKSIKEDIDYIRWVQLPDGQWRLWGSNPGPELDDAFLDRARKQNSIDYKDAKVSKNGEYPDGVDEKDIWDKHRFTKSIQEEVVTESMSGFVQTYCDNCGKKNRVEVYFPEYNRGFETTTYTCPHCQSENELSDPHQYNADGTINEAADYKVKFFQVFEAPKSPKESGKMIGQRGTLEDANAFGTEKVGKGKYIIKAVCDDGQTRPIDNDTKSDAFKMVNEDTAVPSSYEFDDDVDDLTYYYDDEVFKRNLEESPYTEIATKQVMDSDGFMTDYTMYMNINTGEYVFVFGDKDVYSPDYGYFDWECETKEEAEAWFASYNGFDDSDDDVDWRFESLHEEEEKSPVVHKKGDGSYLVQSSSGDGYTAFNRSNVCMGHISAENDNEAKSKFDANKFDESLKENLEGSGWWSVEWDLTLEGEEVRFDDLSESTQEHIADSILDGYLQGEIAEWDDDAESEVYGWWVAKFDISVEDNDRVRFDDLSETTQEHIANAIKDGYTQGEVFE